MHTSAARPSLSQHTLSGLLFLSLSLACAYRYIDIPCYIVWRGQFKCLCSNCTNTNNCTLDMRRLNWYTYKYYVPEFKCISIQPIIYTARTHTQTLNSNKLLIYGLWQTQYCYFMQFYVRFVGSWITNGFAGARAHIQSAYMRAHRKRKIDMNGECRLHR